MNQAMEERFLFLLLLLRQPRLRMVYVTSHADQPLNRGVLPVAAARRHPEPRALAAVPRLGRRLRPRAADRQAARPPAAARAHRAPSIPDTALSHLIPYNSTTARARPRARARHPDVRRRPAALPPRHQDGVPPALRARPGSRYPSRRSRTCTRSTTWWLRCSICTLRGRPPGGRWSSSTRGSSGSGNALVDLRGLPAAGDPRSGGRDGPRRRRCSWRDSKIDARRPTSPSSTSAAASSRSASSVTSCAARACRCGSPRWARSRSSRPTTRSSVGRAASPTSAARFPADPAYAAAITRRRPGGSASCSPTKGVLGRFARRLRHRPPR